MGRPRIPREIRFCGCDCGGSKEVPINSNWQYFRGHCNRRPKEIRVCKNLNCDTTFEVPPKSDRKFCSRSCYCDWRRSSEGRKQASEKTRDKWAEETYRERMLVVRQEQWTPKLRHKQSEIMSLVMKEVMNRPEVKEMERKAKKKWWDSHPEEKVKAGVRLSKLSKMWWQDPEYREKKVAGLLSMWASMGEEEKTNRLHNFILSSRQISGKNKFEEKVENTLNKLFLHEFTYSGNKRLIGRYSPDFIHMSKKLVVLCNGGYWHLTINGLEDTPENRYKRLLKEARPYLDKGYSVMMIWEDGEVVFYLVGEVNPYAHVVSKFGFTNVFQLC